MTGRGRARRLQRTLLLGAVALLVVPAAGASAKLREVAPTYYANDAGLVFTRTKDGVLHLIYPTRAGNGTGNGNGIATRTISPGGALGAQVRALNNLSVSRPGVLVLPNGQLWSIFGAVPPPPKPSGLYGIASTNGGATWSAPVFVGSGSTLEAQSYVADVEAQTLAGSPWLLLDIGGGLVLQHGLGPGSPTTPVNTPHNLDAFVGNVDTAVDGASGEMVAAWFSIATPGGDFIQGLAPATQAPAKVPGQIRTGRTVAGRSAGPGVFTPYSPDNQHVRLFRYGGGSVAVGSVKGLTTKVMGVATGNDGRIWVMWGDDSKSEVAVTRSNKSVTRFGSVQIIKDNAFGISRFSGDGRLGPLDLLIDETPKSPVVEATYYVRVLPALSASVKVHKVSKKKFKLTVTVTDAGTPVSGAKVHHGKTTKTTSAKGVARFSVKGKPGTKVTLKVTDGGYTVLHKTIKL